jgi:tRNA(Ile)-lysidine synthase
LIISPVKAKEFLPLPVEKGTKSVVFGEFTYAFEMLSSPVSIDPNPEMAFLDADQLIFQLQIRSWQEGDSFRPLGMKGAKKVSDFLIDQKVPLALKDSIVVLQSGGQICWIAGMRTDDRFKITPNTKSILKMERSAFRVELNDSSRET